MTHQTRREWLITIGVGIAEKVISAPAADNLPAGVYAPSTDHLSHALMSSGRYHSIPPGCPTEYVLPPSVPFQPRFFSDSEYAVVLRLIQIILGEMSQETAEWVDLRVSVSAEVRAAAGRLNPLHRSLAIACRGKERAQREATENLAQVCRDGLAWISVAAQSKYAQEFVSIGMNEQIAIMQSISDDGPDSQTANAGSRFFTYLKAETIRGFYTSQAGLKELDFKGNAYYARSPGCSA
jgi:hypothetical protein